MESGANKIKIVWICGFTNSLVQSKMSLLKSSDDTAPWISNLLKLFENCGSIELHVISPHFFMNKRKESFVIHGITYHFFRIGTPFFLGRWPSWLPLDFFINHYFLRKAIEKEVNAISPDLIHLHGMENSYHSFTIKNLMNQYKIFVTPQGFLHLVPNKRNYIIDKRVANELILTKNLKYFSYRNSYIKEVISKLNPEATFFYHDYIVKPEYDIGNYNLPKLYDLCFFGRVSQEKGIFDFLEVVSILKKSQPNLRALIIGGVEKNFLAELQLRCKVLEINDNIKLQGFIDKRSDLHELVAQCKISLLPSHVDMIPGTIIESMQLKTAVVSYDIGGISDLKKIDNIISLSTLGDVNNLAIDCLQLLTDGIFYDRRVECAYEYAIHRWGGEGIYLDIINAYNEIIRLLNNKSIKLNNIRKKVYILFSKRIISL